MRHVYVGLGTRACAALAFLLGCIGLLIVIHVLYSPAWFHLTCCSVLLSAELLFAVHYAWLHRQFTAVSHDRSLPEANNAKKTAGQLIRHLQHVGDIRDYLKAW